MAVLSPPAVYRSGGYKTVVKMFRRTESGGATIAGRPFFIPPLVMASRFRAARSPSGSRRVGGQCRWRGATQLRLGRVIGCILFAAQRLARELDEVMGDEAHPKHGIDLAAAQGMARGAPERFAVVGDNADMQENAKGKHQRA